MPRWGWMWAIAAAMFAIVKWASCHGAPWRAASVGRRVGYLLLWPGMDARAFLGAPASAVERPGGGTVAWSLAKIGLGVVLLWVIVPAVPRDRDLLRGWIGMIALVTLLHFGLFDLLSQAWRGAGVQARPLMRNPAASTSVAEFWGRRWNTAFRDAAHRLLFAPLRRVVGPRAALVVGFVASGLAHELVISVPAGAGYGGPTTYFLFQGAALLVERSRGGRALGLGNGPIGAVFTMLVVAPTAFLLFHPPFVRTVMLPFLDAIGAR